MLVDGSGRLRSTAGGFAELLEAHGATTQLAHAALKRRLQDVRGAIAAAQDGKPASVSFSLRRTPKRQLTFSVHPKRPGAVLKLERLAVGAPMTRQLGYEVTSARRDFGRLLAVYNNGTRLPTLGVRCYEQFAGFDAPCGGCPVQELRGGSAQAAGVLHGLSLPQWVAHAQRISPSVALVRGVPLEEPHVSRVVRGRIERAVDKARLSSREQSVLDLLLLGRSLDQIADLLGITPRTVRFHVGNILTKFGADSRADLVRLLL